MPEHAGIQRLRKKDAGSLFSRGMTIYPIGELNMQDGQIAATYVRYFVEGAEADSWAPEELSELAIADPDRAWKIIQCINATSIEGKEWQDSVYAVVGCGVLEELIVAHEEKILPIIIEAAKSEPVLRFELSTIYESSVSPRVWSQIRSLAIK